MKYAYVCTNYNNSHFTVQAVRSLNAGRTPPTLIVVVDNQSSEADRAILTDLAAAHGNVDVVLNEHNVGYFAGLNVGISRSRALEPAVSAMIVGNNDLEFPSDFGDRLTEVVVDGGERPVISPYVETLDGVPQNPHVVAGISRARELVYDLYYSNYHLAKLIRAIAHRTRRVSDRRDEQGFATPGFIYQGHGSCYILTSVFFDRFGELWAPTFLMGEEYFLSRQLAEQGYMTYYDPRVRIVHRCNGALENVPARKMWGLARDAHRVYRRYVKPWHRQAHRFHRKSSDV
jgi:GT2 family glycosyltransferase